jgi:hypothetical protein
MDDFKSPSSIKCEEILAAVNAITDDIRGCRSGALTRFANLDIDIDSLYHNELSLLRLRQVLASVGLKKTRLYRSSNSGGWHLYAFFDSWVDSAQVQQSLSAWLTSQSFILELGQLEGFPQPVTPKSFGHGLRLPLQRGFAWLTDTADVEASREDMTAEEAVSRFVHDLYKSIGRLFHNPRALFRCIFLFFIFLLFCSKYSPNSPQPSLLALIYLCRNNRVD